MLVTNLLKERAGDYFTWQEAIWRDQDPSMLVEHGCCECDPPSPTRIAHAHSSRVDGNPSDNQAGRKRLEPRWEEKKREDAQSATGKLVG